MDKIDPPILTDFPNIFLPDRLIGFFDFVISMDLDFLETVVRLPCTS